MRSRCSAWTWPAGWRSMPAHRRAASPIACSSPARRGVYAVDVGYGQLDYRLRSDPRVVTIERTNLRYLAALPEPVDVATLDLSFISLTKVLWPVRSLLREGGQVVALVKPQFEAGRAEVGRGGIVRDPLVHAAVIGRVTIWAVDHGYRVCGLTTSPIRGADGNREFFLLLQRTP